MQTADPTKAILAKITDSPIVPPAVVQKELDIDRQQLSRLRKAFEAVTGVAIPRDGTAYVHTEGLVELLSAALQRGGVFEDALRAALAEAGMALPEVIVPMVERPVTRAEIQALEARVQALEGVLADHAAWRQHVHENLPIRDVLEPILDDMMAWFKSQGVHLGIAEPVEEVEDSSVMSS